MWRQASRADALSEFSWRPARPTLERPVERAQLGEAEEKRHLSDADVRISEVAARELVTQLIEQLAITGAFSRQRPIQCAHAHLQARGDAHGAWLTVAKLVLQCVPDAVLNTRRCRGFDADVLPGVAVEERGERRIRTDTPQRESRFRNGEGILAGRKMQWRVKNRSCSRLSEGAACAKRISRGLQSESVTNRPVRTHAAIRNSAV